MTAEMKEKIAKLNFNKDIFIEDFIQYLKTGSDNVPLDIINAKISVIDYLYVPVFVYNIKGSVDIKADIGKDHTEYEKVATGRVFIKEEQGFFADDRHLVQEPEYKRVSHTVTNWQYNQVFSVEDEVAPISFCLNSHIASLIQEKLNYDFNFCDITEKQENFKTLSMNYEGRKETDQLIKNLQDKLKSKIQAEFKRRGDREKNVEEFNKNYKMNQMCIYIPIGYIKYNHVSNPNENYYFIESLNDKKTFCKSIPKDLNFAGKNSKVYISLIIYTIIYAILLFLALSAGKTVFFTVLIILLCDFFAIYGIIALNKQENIAKRKEYIAKIFNENQEKLKDLIYRLDKPYRE